MIFDINFFCPFHSAGRKRGKQGEKQLGESGDSQNPG